MRLQAWGVGLACGDPLPLSGSGAAAPSGSPEPEPVAEPPESATLLPDPKGMGNSPSPYEPLL